MNSAPRADFRPFEADDETVAARSGPMLQYAPEPVINKFDSGAVASIGPTPAVASTSARKDNGGKTAVERAVEGDRRTSPGSFRRTAEPEGPSGLGKGRVPQGDTATGPSTSASLGSLARSTARSRRGGEA